MLRDAARGNLDFLLIDLPPGTGDIHLSIIQEVPVTGAVIVSTPQHVALADVKKGIAMFTMESINIPVLGLIENMAYFTPEELPENKYYFPFRADVRFVRHVVKIGQRLLVHQPELSFLLEQNRHPNPNLKYRRLLSILHF